MLERLTIIVALASAAFAQEPAPEVRGVVHEAGSTTGIPGVEVELSEITDKFTPSMKSRKVASTFTDANGAFSFKPEHMGEFQVMAKKKGYQANGWLFTLSANAPLYIANLTLIRPGSLTGRVIDDEGRPMANYPVSVETAPIGGDVEAITDTEGFFVANDLPPGSWVVHIQPKQARAELVEYSAAEFAVIDEEAESAYWPGGVKARDQVLSVPVASGGTNNVGTIRVRKTPYYRVHVSLAGECAPNERWIYRILGESDQFPPIHEQFGGCRKEFLLTGLKPGSHTLAVWVGRDVKAWGLVPFTITDANVEAALRLTSSISVSGRVKAAEGHTLAELGGVQVLLRPDDALGGGEWIANLDAAGAFTYQTVAWPQQLLSVEARKAGTYVREIRYNGLPIKGPRVDMVPGARFEIVLDSGGATLRGKAKRDDGVLAVRDGVELGPPGEVRPFQVFADNDREGNFKIGNLPPGAYRVIVLGPDTSAEEFALLVSRAEKVTVQANETKAVDVKK